MDLSFIFRQLQLLSDEYNISLLPIGIIALILLIFLFLKVDK